MQPPKSKVKLSAEQAKVVAAVLAPPGDPAEAKVAVVTGNPGTGKTTTSEEIVRGFESMWPRGYVALSPTGKAAKRFTEVTGYPCLTIHRALAAWERELGGSDYGPPEGLPSLRSLRAVIIDEASMIDQELFLRLLAMLPPWTRRIVLVGDADQLPSVGAGCVLRDLIASGRIPSFRLEFVWRQDEHSWIRKNTQSINRGQRPIVDPESIDWFETMCGDDVEAAVDRVVTLAQENPAAQVLTPIRRGALGADNLNRLVRAAVNPVAGRQGWKAGDKEFFRNDRVIHIKNDYPRDVFNGECGVVIGPIEREGSGIELAVDYGGRIVYYDAKAAKDKLELSFALTIHKSQGSEYPGVIAILHSSHYYMLSRQLAYVAASRAQERVWIVGNEKGVQRAVRNNQTVERRTRLAVRINEAFDTEKASPGSWNTGANGATGSGAET